jgi:hypothetical protein
MGGGSWDSRLFADSARDRRAKGVADFSHHDSLRYTPRDSWKPHDDLDPAGIKKSVFGVRESRDSAEHTDTVAISVFFDVTG